MMTLYAQKHDNCPTCRCTEPLDDLMERALYASSERVIPPLETKLRDLVKEWRDDAKAISKTDSGGDGYEALMAKSCADQLEGLLGE